MPTKRAISKHRRLLSALALTVLWAGLSVSTLRAAEPKSAPDDAAPPLLMPQEFREKNAEAIALLGAGTPETAHAALDVFESISPSVDALDDPKSAARFFYNFAWAQKKTGSKHKATKSFLRALREDSHFIAGYDATFHALRNDAANTTTGLEQTIRLLGNLLDYGELSTVQRNLNNALYDPEWQRERKHPQLLRILIRYWTEARVTPEEYAQRWIPFLAPLAKNIDNTQPALNEGMAGQMLSQIDLLYMSERLDRISAEEFAAFKNATDDFNTADKLYFFEDVGHARTYYAHWKEGLGRTWRDDYASFVDFIRMIADDYMLGDRPDLAVKRYLVAWGLNSKSAESAIEFSNALLAAYEYGDVSYCDVEWKYFEDSIMSTLLSEKNKFGAKDWARALRLHTVLGLVYSKQGKIGPASKDDQQNAIFHYKQALKQHEIGRILAPRDSDAKEQSAVPPELVPELHAKYARATMTYADERRNDEEVFKDYQGKAWTHFIDAAEQYDALEREREVLELLHEICALKAATLPYASRDTIKTLAQKYLKNPHQKTCLDFLLEDL